MQSQLRPETFQEDCLRYFFLRGLKDYVRRHVGLARPKDLHAAIGLAISGDDEFYRVKDEAKPQPTSDRGGAKSSPIGATKKSRNKGKEHNADPPSKCFRCGGQHWRNQCKATEEERIAYAESQK